MGSKKTRAAVSAVTYILISILAVICVFPILLDADFCIETEG